jgi:cytochrome c5
MTGGRKAAKAKMREKKLTGRPRRGLVLAAVLVTAALGTAVWAQDAAEPDPDDMAAANERASKLDPEDYQFMQPVCTRCHSARRILSPKTWPRWQRTFANMKENGAVGTDEQWEHIRKFVARSLTTINVNHADEDELSAVLGVDEKTAITIVQRRRFNTVEDVEAVPGVDKTVIEAIRPRLLFDQPFEDQ